MNCPTLIDLLANIRQEETMHSQRTPNSTPNIAMVAYKNKRFNQRGESSKSWIRKAPNTKPRGMQFNNTYCKICRSKTKFGNYQPWRRVQTHLFEEMDDDKDIGDRYHNQNDGKYYDVLLAFIAESLFLYYSKSK